MTVLPLTGSGHVRYVRTLRTSRIRIDTLVVGHGTTKVVFLHGLGGTPLLYYWLLQMLARELDLTIYCAFLPNHGESSNLSTFAEIDSALAEWAAELSLLKVPWIGHSIGAYFALAMAIYHPELVSEVVALAPPVAAPHDRRPLTPVFLAPRLGYLGLEALVMAAVARPAAWIQGHGWEFEAAVRDLFFHPPRLHHMISAFDAAPDLLPLLPKVTGIPLVYVFGSHDWVVPAPREPLPGTTHIVGGAVHCFPFATWTAALAAIVAIVAKAIGAQPATATSPSALPFQAVPA
jgi:pimeloyl-ACP methyl ester carboxylesterase